MNYTKLEKSELIDVVKQKDKEIRNLIISLNAQTQISTVATNELNKMKGRIKDKAEKTASEILQEQQATLKKIELQFKTRKFA